MAGVLLNALLLPTTPVPRKLARLWVVSDVLHNSGGYAEVGVSQAWRYRDIFAKHLPRVCAHWGDVAFSFPGRIKQESVRVQVALVIDTWEQALIFPPALIDTLRRALNTGTKLSGANTQLDLQRVLNPDTSANADPKVAPNSVTNTGTGTGIGTGTSPGSGADPENDNDHRDDDNDDDVGPATLPLIPFTFRCEKSEHIDRIRSLSPGESVDESVDGSLEEGGYNLERAASSLSREAQAVAPSGRPAASASAAGIERAAE